MNNQDLNKRESGYALTICLIFLAILSMIGAFALNTTDTELNISRNDRVAKQDLFNQESVITYARLNKSYWYTEEFMMADEKTAYFPHPGVNTDQYQYRDSLGNIVGSYKVRKIESTGTPITTWDDIDKFASPEDHPANKYPRIDHIAPPPTASGYDPQNFQIRRFAITSYSDDDDKNVEVQEGVYMLYAIP